MHVGKALFALLGPMLVASACATATPAYNRQVPPDARSLIASSEVVLPIAQSEIRNYEAPTAGSTYVPYYAPAGTSPGAAAAGNLIAALIIAGVEAGMDAVAEGEIKPLRASLADFSFDQTLQAEVKTALAQASWLNAGEPRILKEVTFANLNSAVEASTASGVLMVDASYQLSPDASEVWVSINPAYFPKTFELQAMRHEIPSRNAAPTSSANGIYRNTFTFRSQAPNATDNRVANIAIWGANNGEPMRAALKQGATKLAQMLVDDMQALPYSQIDPKTTALAPYSYEQLSGYVLRTDTEGQVIALTTGPQVYVSNSVLQGLQKKPATPRKPSRADRAMKATTKVPKAKKPPS